MPTVIPLSSRPAGSRPERTGDGSGRRWFGLALLAFAAAVAAIVTVFVAADRYLKQNQVACNYPRPATPPVMAWYVLPLGVASTALMVLSAGLACLGWRRLAKGTAWRDLASALTLAALCGALVSAWFGIYTVHDGSIPLHCGG